MLSCDVLVFNSSVTAQQAQQAQQLFFERGQRHNNLLLINYSVIISEYSENTFSLIFSCCACCACCTPSNSLKVNPILQTYPADCPRRQHVTGGFHTKTGQPPSVLPEPPLESPAAHPSGIGQFVFVRAFHGISFFTLQRYENNLIYARKRTTKNTDNRAQNRQTRTKGVSALPRCRTFAV